MFTRDPRGNKKYTWVIVETVFKKTTNRSLLKLEPRSDGEWNLVQFIRSEHLNLDVTRNIMQELVNAASRVLKTINMWPQKQTPNGAEIAMNEIMPPRGVTDQVFISFRSGMLDLPSPKWENLWDRIKSRVQADPYFKVQGFDHADIMIAVDLLSELFPASWVRARYRNAGIDNMSGEFQRDEDEWFPAYHLARTAQGAICVDPGWNYLTEIGLSVRDLQNFDGIEQLKQQIARSPGTQHHLCLAAELFKRRFLVGLEPRTGSGSATNDLLTSIEGRQYAIEVKEFRSSSPLKRLAKEIAKKAKRLPEHPHHPVVFHIVLSETSTASEDHAREREFFDNLETILPMMPAQISAIVGCTRFIDSSGGRVKRHTQKIVLNPSAYISSNYDDLVTLFPTNTEVVQYPLFGIGIGANSLFYFGKQ